MLHTIVTPLLKQHYIKLRYLSLPSPESDFLNPGLYKSYPSFN